MQERKLSKAARKKAGRKTENRQDEENRQDKESRLLGRKEGWKESTPNYLSSGFSFLNNANKSKAYWMDRHIISCRLMNR